MNRYGRMALDHWKKWRPENFARITDPEPFFQRLGEEVWQEIDCLSRALAGPDLPNEGFMGKLGRLNMARANAESQILREMVLLSPEKGVDGDEEDEEEGVNLFEGEMTLEEEEEYVRWQAEREADWKEWEAEQAELAKKIG